MLQVCIRVNMMIPILFTNNAQHMDELFLMPQCPLAIPRAYWLNPDERVMSSQLLLIRPSKFEFNRIMEAINIAERSDYDMEIVNDLYRDSALILPHRPYTLLTGELRNDNHSKYMGNSNETWNPDAIMKEAKYVHFSDWPVPKVCPPCSLSAGLEKLSLLTIQKPWIDPPSYIMDEKKPSCQMNISTGHLDDCRNRDYWLGLYADFTKRRTVLDTPSTFWRTMANKHRKSAALMYNRRQNFDRISRRPDLDFIRIGRSLVKILCSFMYIEISFRCRESSMNILSHYQSTTSV
jgi:hypothetical protein